MKLKIQIRKIIRILLYLTVGVYMVKHRCLKRNLSNITPVIFSYCNQTIERKIYI